jgi:hypothetical protein
VESHSSCTTLGCMKDSVAPLLRRAFLVAHCPDICITMSTFIARFRAIYTDIDLQAQVRATALKPRQNPVLRHR